MTTIQILLFGWPLHYIGLSNPRKHNNSIVVGWIEIWNWIERGEPEGDGASQGEKKGQLVLSPPRPLLLLVDLGVEANRRVASGRRQRHQRTRRRSMFGRGVTPRGQNGRPEGSEIARGGWVILLILLVTGLGFPYQFPKQPNSRYYLHSKPIRNS